MQKMTYIWYLLHWLAHHGLKSAEDQATKLDRLTGRDIVQGAKIILKLLFLIQRGVLWSKTKNT